MKVRAKDIAKRLGVSPATVSNALNGRKGVGEEMTQRIHETAQEMGYFAEKRAQSSPSNAFIRLVIYKRHGQVVMDTQFFMELIEGIERECRNNGLELVITHLHQEKDANLDDRIRTICNEDCAGIMLLATEMYVEDLVQFESVKSPMIALDNIFPHHDIETVAIDNFEAGYHAARYLISMGHRHIGHITSALRFYNSDDRLAGFEAAMREADLPVGPEDIISVTPTVEGAYRDMGLHLQERKEPLPTAFFAFNDIAAVGSIRALSDAGHSLYKDISMIGMDDTSICQISKRPLSTLRVFREEMGVAAVRRLMAMGMGEESEAFLKTTVSVRLVPRETVRDLRAGHEEA